MAIKITFYGPLTRWAGKNSYQAQGNTIYQVFEDLGHQLGKSVINHLINQNTGDLKSHFHILLNGKDIELMNGLQQKVKDGDIITVVPPIGGGA